MSKQNNLKHSQPSFRPPISTVPQLDIRTSLCQRKSTDKNKLKSGIYFLNTRSLNLGGFQRTASWPTVTCFGRFNGEGRAKDSASTKVWDFFSFEQSIIFIICSLDIINLLQFQSLDFRSSRGDRMLMHVLELLLVGGWGIKKNISNICPISATVHPITAG